MSRLRPPGHNAPKTHPKKTNAQRVACAMCGESGGRGERVGGDVWVGKGGGAFECTPLFQARADPFASESSCCVRDGRPNTKEGQARVSLDRQVRKRGWALWPTPWLGAGKRCVLGCAVQHTRARGAASTSARRHNRDAFPSRVDTSAIVHGPRRPCGLGGGRGRRGLGGERKGPSVRRCLIREHRKRNGMDEPMRHARCPRHHSFRSLPVVCF